jgi:hypothetical protein
MTYSVVLKLTSMVPDPARGGGFGREARAACHGAPEKRSEGANPLRADFARQLAVSGR